MNTLNTLYTSDQKYIDIMLSSMYSLAINSNIDQINFHIISENYAKEDYHKIETIMTQFPNIDLVFYPIEEFDIEKYQIPNWHGTQIANARLFFQEIMKTKLHQIDHLLYLDSDTIVVGDLNQIEQYEHGTYAVKDTGLRSYYEKLNNLSTYYNSGVLYINIDDWVGKNYQEQIRNFAFNNKQIQLSYPDQDILNCALEEKINELPMQYNMAPYPYIFNKKQTQAFYNPRKRNTSAHEVEEAKKDPKILHSYGLLGIKPWMKNSVNPFNGPFLHYIKKVNPDFEVEEISKMKKILSCSPELFNNLLLLKTYLPDCLEGPGKRMTLKLHEPSQHHYPVDSKR